MNQNAGISLTTKLRQLETIQQTAAKTRILPDGRIRYYKAERMAAYPGRTRGSAYVTEYNPTTGQVRGWNECYDQFGDVKGTNTAQIWSTSMHNSQESYFCRVCGKRQDEPIWGEDNQSSTFNRPLA